MPARSTKARGPYSVHPGIAMVRKWADELEANSGRSLDAWMTFIRRSGPKEEKACRAWLKDEHEIGGNVASWLVERAFEKAMGLREDTAEGYLALAPTYVEQQYAGKKATLKPIFEQLLALGLELGKDVRVCPCKTIVPIYREHVIAQIKPTTITRVDLGLWLARVPADEIKNAGERLIDTGGLAKKDRITHRIGIASLDEIDGFVERWLKRAYALDVCP